MHLGPLSDSVIALAADSQLIPLYGVGLSVVTLVLQAVKRRQSFQSSKAALGDPAEVDMDRAQTEEAGVLNLVLTRSGGGVFLCYKLARLACCLALVCLSIATLPNESRGPGSTIDSAWWLRLAECDVYAYSTVLGLACILVSRYNSLLSDHLCAVLFLTWVVYAYRDVLPLATTTLQPADAEQGPLLWVKLVVLTIAAVIIPCFIPQPASHNSTAGEALSKEETAGWYSRRMFSWLNATVARAQQVEHMSLEELPPLANADSTSVLVKNSLQARLSTHFLTSSMEMTLRKYLDPLQTRNKTHIFWGFLKLYRSEYLLGALLALCSSVIGLSWPLATQGLLESLVQDHASLIRPWAWVLFLFAGATLATVFEVWFEWIMNRLSIRTEAIVTELLFQHALRIRVKAETSEDDQAVRDPEAMSASAGSLSDNGGRAAEASTPENRNNSFIMGKLNNLVTNDLANVTEGNRQWLLLLIKSPAMIGVAIVFMYSVLGWSALVGLATLIALLPVPGYLSGWIQSFQKGMMSKTDQRVQLTSEILNVIRMIKLFGWEPRVAAQIDDRREAELKYIVKTRWLEVTNNLFNYSIPLVTMAVTFATYTVLMKGELTASKLFSSNAAFMLIQQRMHLIFFQLPALTQARVSLDRIDSFLHETELLDEFSVPEQDGSTALPRVHAEDEDVVLGIRRTSFTWTTDSELPTPTSGTNDRREGRKFVLRIDGQLLFKRGRTNLIVGPTGSGKTSLLMALLGTREMHAKPAGPESFVSLPRGGGIAYAAQESWVLSDTIRNNILFGAPYDEVRYAKVIKQCALERDLSLFDAGDKTEVGEKGITLSGGQKARITLARAIYSFAEILLLDDVLAALDVHTGRWIVDHCFKSDLVHGRTVILVSHNVALVHPIADYVVVMGTDGQIASQGTLERTLEADQELSAELATEEEQLRKAENELGQSEHNNGDDPKSGKLIVSEEIEEGQVGWNTIRLYVLNTSRHPKVYWTIFVLMLAVTHSVLNGQTYFLGTWAAQYEERNPSEVSVSYYLSIYGLLVVATMSAYAAAWLIYATGSLRASKIVHNKLISSVLSTTLRWLDMTPTSRIIARCTADMQSIDTSIPRIILAVVETSIFLILRIVATSLMAPIFVVPSVVIGFIGSWLGRIYLKAQMCVKREMSNARAPVLGHFGSAIAGLVSIRAYNAQERFKSESYSRVDRYSRAAFTYNGLDRWITIRVDIMGTFLSSILAAYLIYVARMSASNAGFTMTMAVGFSSMILGWDGPRVLHELSFEVKSGERIGIVGRTGSGKSSLTLALLRCIPTVGKVYYDGIVTDSVNLDALRSNITIIPQTPEMLGGTLRKNLDPFEQHDDATLNDALRSAGLFALQHMSAEGSNGGGGARLTLDSEIAAGGGNLSVGQRQIMALARAIVRRSKLLILDEATSAIDYETDAIIQRSLRAELGRDVTVLTVAHRLQSIMDADKIMVLDAGKIVEYDSPRVLLAKQGGYFRSLVDDSGDKALPYAQAGYIS
ncbi:multidrug resistance-associated ABC transporter [Trametes punicea]|nr:multidrug resistance-associated ABC transporter [Trametes punicea]